MFQTRDLGLAAYILSKGYNLYRCEDKYFIFTSCIEPENSEKRESCEEFEMLSVEYVNSCCRKHDANVLFLKSLLTMKGKKS